MLQRLQNGGQAYAHGCPWVYGRWPLCRKKRPCLARSSGTSRSVQPIASCNLDRNAFVLVESIILFSTGTQKTGREGKLRAEQVTEYCNHRLAMSMRSRPHVVRISQLERAPTRPQGLITQSTTLCGIWRESGILQPKSF